MKTIELVDLLVNLSTLCLTDNGVISLNNYTDKIDFTFRNIERFSVIQIEPEFKHFFELNTAESKISLQTILTSYNVQVYANIDDFLTSCNGIYSGHNDIRIQSVLICNYNNKYGLHLSEDEIAHSQNKYDTTFGYWILNQMLAFNFANYLRGIVDHFDDGSGYVLFTSTLGVIKFKMDIKDNPISIKESLLESINRFHDIYSISSMQIFVKNTIIAFLSASFNRTVSTLINNLNIIIDDSNREYQLFLEQYSFDKMKEKWQTELEKYFDKLRELLSKTLGQIGTIPIALIAFVLSSSEKTEESNMLTVFLLGFTIYAFFSLAMQIAILLDINILCKDVNDDESLLKDKYKENYKLVKSKYDQFKHRLNYLKVICYVLSIFFAILSLVIILRVDYTRLICMLCKISFYLHL